MENNQQIKFEFLEDIDLDLSFEKTDSFLQDKKEEPEIVENIPVEQEQKYKPEYKEKKEAPQIITGEEKQEEVEEPTQEYSIIPFAKAWFEQEGWEWNDKLLPEDSLKGFTTLLKNIIAHNSKPVYSSEEVKKFDEYVKNGGDPFKYLSTVYAEERGTVLKLNPENSKHQKKILEVFYKETTKFEPEDIIQLIDLLEAGGKLESEAKKAHSKLTAIAEQRAQELEIQQKNERERQEREIDQYIEKIKSTVREFSYIAGYEVTEKDKENFLAYILKPDKDGKTEYEKELSSNLEVSLKTAFMMYKKMYDKKVDNNLKSKAAKEIFEALGNLGKKPSTSKTYSYNKDFDEALKDL